MWCVNFLEKYIKHVIALENTSMAGFFTLRFMYLASGLQVIDTEWRSRCRRLPEQCDVLLKCAWRPGRP